jgi:hypothetical protein
MILLRSWCQPWWCFKETANGPQCSCAKQRSASSAWPVQALPWLRKSWANPTAAVCGARPEHLCCDLSSWAGETSSTSATAGLRRPCFHLVINRSKHPQLLIGGGRRCRRHITELGRRRRSRLRWGRTGRRRRAGLRACVLTPLISDEQPESPESGERRGYPRPDVPGAARPVGTPPLIVAARIGVAWVSHDSTPFLVDQRC